MHRRVGAPVTAVRWDGRRCSSRPKYEVSLTRGITRFLTQDLDRNTVKAAFQIQQCTGGSQVGTAGADRQHRVPLW